MKYDERACKFNMDTGCVELTLQDGRKISIDCTGAEDVLNVTGVQTCALPISSAVNGDHSPIPEQQLHAAGIHVELAGSFIVLHNHTLQILLLAYGLRQGIGGLRRPREPSLLYPKKTKNPNPSPIGNRFGFFLFGGRGWIRTTEAESSRFTVCPHWPLGNTPIFSFCSPWIACIYYHPDGSLSTSFAEFLDFCAESKNTKAKAAQKSTFLSGFLELVTGVEPATH